MTPARSSARDAESSLLFAFQGRDLTLCGHGQAAALSPGPADTLAGRLDAFFRAAGPEAVLAGALPFDRTRPDDLRQPLHLSDRLPAPGGDLPDRWRLRHEPDAAGYADAVRRALAIMDQEGGKPEALTKIVLSRSLLATAETPIDPLALLHRLAADPAATAFLVPLPTGGRALAGATPELLLRKRGAAIASHPLAGSARRRGDAAADRDAGQALMGSDKDHREHAIVVEFILDTLSPWCKELERPEGTALTRTRSMWHLGTRIEGRLKDAGVSAAALAAALHPTPAVCGTPRERAAGLIGELEPHDRGFYAGSVGWCDGRGDGDWHVAIRCADLSGQEARLYAGAGIVPGSDPWKEADETAAKYGAMLAALGIGMEEGEG